MWLPLAKILHDTPKKIARGVLPKKIARNKNNTDWKKVCSTKQEQDSFFGGCMGGGYAVTSPSGLRLSSDCPVFLSLWPTPATYRVVLFFLCPVYVHYRSRWNPSVQKFRHNAKTYILSTRQPYQKFRYNASNTCVLWTRHCHSRSSNTMFIFLRWSSDTMLSK